MFTPAMSASSTSLPSVIRRKARVTQFSGPALVNWKPEKSEMTTGFTVRRINSSAERGAAPATPAVAAARGRR